MMTRGTRYIDVRTGQNIVNMAGELQEIAERLELFHLNDEAIQASVLAERLHALGNNIRTKLTGRGRVRTGEKNDTEGTP